MEWQLTNQPTEAEIKAVYGGLVEYNLERLECKEIQPLAILVREDERICAGLSGETFGNWLNVKYLWVSAQLRGQDVGTRLLQQAEEEAKRRGCRYVFLNTYGFQARGFYLKQGYTEVFTQDNYPITGKRHYLTKEL